MHHFFNGSCIELAVVLTDNNEYPTATNTRPAIPGDPSGRGSIVFYNQAAMFYGPETGHPTLHEARKHGQSGTTNFYNDIKIIFPKMPR
jgi:hypothetical protein